MKKIKKDIKILIFITLGITFLTFLNETLLKNINILNNQSENISLYGEFLANLDNTSEEGKFFLSYLDEDDFPELFYTEDCFHLAFVEVYTIENEEIKELGSYGQYGAISFAPKKGVIRDSFIGYGKESSSYIKIQNKNAYIDTSIQYDFVNDIYKINGTIVDEREYYNIHSQYNYDFVNIEYDQMFDLTSVDFENFKNEYKQFIIDNKKVELRNGWINDDNHWFYLIDDIPQTGWLDYENNKYYLSSDGIMQKDWQEIDGQWYYFDDSGKMQTGWQTINGEKYVFNEKGVMQTGWITSLHNDKYYLDDTGVLQTGWQEIGKNWYYFDDIGKMQTGWQTINGKKYVFNEIGEMQTGWIISEHNNKYYLDDTGVLQTGWQEIDNHWYYFDDSGKMQVGKQNIDGKVYNFDVNGIWIK